MASSTYYMLPLTVLVQYLTNAGVIASGATVTTQVAGSVNTLVTTYTDSTGLVPNANPMTLNSSGRAANPQTAALVGFWVPSGTTVDVYFADTLGETWSIKSMSGINDPAGTNSLQNLLASAASSNSSGSGPVAGADLVANAVKSYDVIADVRAANAPTLVSGQTLTISVQGGAAINDGLGGNFYWNATSTTADNGATVLKPSSLTSGAAGRWIRLGTPPNGAIATIASAATTDLGTAGSNNVSISGTTAITSFGATAQASAPLYVIGFQGSLLLTYNSVSMILPGNASIATLPGDYCLAWYAGGGNWIVLAYFPAVGPQQQAYKNADQSLTTTTVLTNDNALFSQTLDAGATYLLQLRYQLAGVGGTGQGYKVAVTFSGSLTGLANGGGVLSSNGAPAAFSLGLGSTITQAAISTTGDIFNYDVTFQVNAAGQINVQFAQNSSSANATVAKANSTLTIQRVQ